MKTSTEIASATKIVGEEKAVELIARAGFDGWDFSMSAMWTYNWGTHSFEENAHPLSSGDYLGFARRLKRIADENGIICNQSHAPFPSHVEKYAESEKYLKRAIECTAEVGGKICIIHPDNNASPEENAEFYFKLLPFAKEYGVKIATENMWNWDEKEGRALFAACSTAESFKAHIDAVNDEYFVACLDIGHAEMMGDMANAREIAYALGSSLQSLHIHDNDKRYDRHQIPYSMNINLDAVATALRDINYNGWITLEADAYLKKYDETNVFDGICALHTAAERFEKRFLGE